MAAELDRDAGELLVVCTANVCRSPLAMRRFATAFNGSERLGGVVVSSAGTRTDEGWMMCSVSAGLLPDDPEDQAFAAGHRSRPLTREAVAAADLVISMEREQRSAVAQLAPGSQAKVYTLREVEGLLSVLRSRDGERPADLAALARALHSVRGLAPLPPEVPRRRWFQRPAEPEDPLTIVDGHGLDDERHESAVSTVRATTDRVAAAVLAVMGE